MSVPHLTESGFFLHLFAYLVLAVFGYLAYPRRSFAILSFVFLYSIAMEILQLFIPYRSFNYLDIAANFMGILLLILFLASIKMLHPNIRNGTEYDK